MYPKYMCIVLYVTLLWCNGIPYTYCQLEWGYMYSQYMCIMLYVKHIWCNGILQIYYELEVWGVDVFSVYVYSAVCESYLV